MTIYTSTATFRSTSGNSVGVGVGGVKSETATVELAAAASSSTVTFFKVPSNARILGASQVYWDDLATSGSPTLDIGLFAVNANVTSDDDALNDGLALSSASTGTRVVKDIANYGKRAWEFVSGQTTDPGGYLTVKGTVRDAATTATGTITAEFHYVID